MGAHQVFAVLHQIAVAVLTFAYCIFGFESFADISRDRNYITAFEFDVLQTDFDRIY